jgi:hypothetical protein
LLTVLVSDLLPPADAPDAMRALRLPALEKWLGRARSARAPSAGTTQWLARAWRREEPLPVAALTLASDEGAQPGSWMRADPVHLRVERDALMLHDAASLAVSREEADSLIAALGAFFAGDGMEFTAPVPGRWYVRVPEGETPSTTPLDDAVGRNVFGMLPAQGKRIRWHAAVTEAQMLLAAHPANAVREEAGLPAINGVWFWGGGEWPGTLVPPFASVIADHELARGLAIASGLSPASLPERLDAVPASASGILVVLDQLTAPLRRGNADEWIVAAQALDRDWFAGLGDAASRHGGVRIVLPGHRDTAVFDLPAGARWHFFRRAKALATHA